MSTRLPEHRLCVYCGSSPGKNPEFMATAQAFGTTMARAGFGLVYGGGSIGLMGEVARAVLAAGGHVTGIIPEFLVKKERMLDGVNELIVTRSMHERKHLMFEKSTGFVALPGGIGTLEELAEITTWAQLNQHAKPVIIVDVAGYWEHLLKLLDHMRAEGFIRADAEVFLDVAKTIDDVIPLYRQRLSTARQKVPLAAIKQQL
ncbi:MAG: TIGR00730 family Rossman fold protein [Pseudomonadota bacterium]|nr:TIGR00730 family Rossman fold protein [Pseudomonadota bacterium]